MNCVCFGVFLQILRRCPAAFLNCLMRHTIFNNYTLYVKKCYVHGTQFSIITLFT